jgi:sugar lactone lactonase YvrE
MSPMGNLGTRRARRRWTGALVVGALFALTLPIQMERHGASVASAESSGAGTIDTFAGNGQLGRGGDGGSAAAAQVQEPGGLAVDGNGNVYISQPTLNVIRRVDPDGVISTFAGTGDAASSGDGALAANATVWAPRGMAVGPDGALYVAEWGSQAIRRIDLGTGIITTVASPSAKLTETTHPAAIGAGYVERPWALAFGPDGALYVSGRGAFSWDDGFWIRRIDLEKGEIGTYAGTGQVGNQSTLGDNGPRAQARFDDVRGLAFDADGNLLLADYSLHRVRRIDGATGIITTVLGDGRQFWEDGDGRPSTEAFANFPTDVFVDVDSGAWYLSNQLTLKRIDPDGTVGTIAGIGPTQGDGGPSVLAQLRGGALALLPDGRILAAEETFTNRVRVITPGSPPAAPSTVAVTSMTDTSLTVTVNPTTGLTRLHEVRISPPATTRRIDEPRNFYSEMPQAVALDPSMTRTTTFADVDPRLVTTVEARAHNGWGFGPWRTIEFSVTPPTTTTTTIPATTTTTAPVSTTTTTTTSTTVPVVAPAPPPKVDSGTAVPARSITEIGGRPGRTAVVSIGVTNTAGRGFFQILDCEEIPGAYSNLNAAEAGQTIANLALVRFADDGRACIYNHTTADIFVDVQGYLDPEAFTTDTQRLLDTRSGNRPPLPAGQRARFTGQPNGLAVISIIATDSLRRGYLQVLPCDAPPGAYSNLNVDRPGQTIANLAIVQLDSRGTACVYTHGGSHVVVDLQGYLSPGSFTPEPRRLRDTRATPTTPPLQPRARIDVTGARPNGLAIISLVATQTRQRGFVQALPCNRPPGEWSNLNTDRAEQTIANLAVTQLGSNGGICLYTHGGAHLVADLQGYLTPTIFTATNQRILDTRNR